jgi:tRNA pseudouridine55 synthase
MDEYKNLNGILVVDKPIDLTSYQTIDRIKKTLNPKKIGHVGTLDPLATGLLLVCLNGATKLAYFLQDLEKEYEGTMKLGEETDTQDAYGKIISKCAFVQKSKKEIEDAFFEFKGTIWQIPPMFSAIKKNGIPLYRLARRGEEVKREPRKIEIYKIEIKNIDIPYITFNVVCSKGTYIRSLVYDIGKKLGCGAHLTALKRLRSGNFTIEDALSLNRIIKLAKEKNLENFIIPPEKAITLYPPISLNSTLTRRVKNGMLLYIKDLEEDIKRELNQEKKFKLLDPKGRLIAVAEKLNLSFGKRKEMVLKTMRVFN